MIGAFLLGSASPALAWGNNGNSFGSHDWILFHASRLAASRGVSWVETSTALRATDDPDTVILDFYYHSYDIWGDTYGDAPTMIVDRYQKVVGLLKAGKHKAASKELGRLAHYYGDINEPLHTDGPSIEPNVHKPYEAAVNRAMTSSGANLKWLHDDGDKYVRDPYKKAVNAATHAHGFYTTLVRGFLAGGYSSPMKNLTGFNVDRAVNDMADIICSATADAGLTTATAPALPAATVGMPGVSGKTAKGTTFSLKGALGPRHPAGEWAVTLYFYRYESGYWKLRKTVGAKVEDSGEVDSLYRTSTSLPSSGKWRVRAVHSDAGHRWSASGYCSITVP